MILSDSTFSVTPTHAHPLPTDRLVCFRDDDILMDEQGASPTLPTLEQAGSLLAQSPFELAHTAAFTLWCPHPMQDNAVPEGNTLRYCPIGVFRTLPHEMASLIVACRHLWTWYRANRLRLLRQAARPAHRRTCIGMRCMRPLAFSHDRPRSDRSHHQWRQPFAGS